jgi:hypothetical protein
MSHFSVKSLTFYGVAISSVLILFKVVSAYGESNLTAAPKIGGLYPIIESQKLPDCLADQKLNLTVEQSGVYLFGNLAVQSKSSEKNTTEVPLSGDFKNQEIIMSGKGNLANCNSELQLTIQGHREKDNLVGKIKNNSTGREGVFAAHYQEIKLESSEEKKH